jgi:NAD(P)-dependent dehydrogenase (short-subunit alcohol dehydrogenase family)
MENTSKSILVTGCSSGIGYHCARILHDRGYLVVTSARKQADVNKLKENGWHAVLLDVDDDKSIESGLEACLRITAGKLDFLFNNAGFGQPGAVEDLTRKNLERQFTTNVFGTFELTRRVIKLMRQQGHGRIAFNSSVLGLVSLPFRGAYNASKQAMEGITDTLRMELKMTQTNIQVGLIEPGPVESLFRQNALMALRDNLNFSESPHKQAYESVIKRLAKPGPAAPFTLPADAVAAKLIDFLESTKPKPRYYVTFPTYLFGYLKRILSTNALDRVLMKVSRGENK